MSRVDIDLREPDINLEPATAPTPLDELPLQDPGEGWVIEAGTATPAGAYAYRPDDGRRKWVPRQTPSAPSSWGLEP